MTQWRVSPATAVLLLGTGGWQTRPQYPPGSGALCTLLITAPSLVRDGKATSDSQPIVRGRGHLSGVTDPVQASLPGMTNCQVTLPLPLLFSYQFSEAHHKLELKRITAISSSNTPTLGFHEGASGPDSHLAVLHVSYSWQDQMYHYVRASLGPPQRPDTLL